jgi:hypothetical protein
VNEAERIYEVFRPWPFWRRGTAAARRSADAPVTIR